MAILTGYGFDNPDTTSSYHAPEWGMLVTPNEIRYDELFGNPLVAESYSQLITDEQLADYVRVTIAYMERELNIDILPRLIRYENDANGVRTDIDDSSYLAPMTRKQQKQLYIRELGYPLRINQTRNEFFIKLRRRPVREVLCAQVLDPYTATQTIDFMPYRMIKKGLSGICYFRPRIIANRFNNFQYLFNYYYNAARSNTLHNVFLIDYLTGYEKAEDVPDDLRWIIKKIAAITCMSIFGDGKTAAIASRSVNLNSVSESISTTMSATSAMFGARILQYQKEIKDWFAQNRSKYSRTTIGCL